MWFHNNYRADDGEGWYCTLAHTVKGRHPVNTDYFTSGDTHYYTMSDVMKGLRKEIDEGRYEVEREKSYALPSRTQSEAE